MERAGRNLPERRPYPSMRGIWVSGPAAGWARGRTVKGDGSHGFLDW
jgi:hypothetical protein